MNSKISSILKKGNSSSASMITIVLIVMCIGLNLINNAFLSKYNVSTLIRTASFTTIVAFGQTLVLLTGGIDLSVAGIAGVSGIISAWLMVNTGINPFLCILITIMAGFAAGCINGLIITKVKLVPFIVTLATGEIFGGLIYLITQGWPIQNIPASVTVLGRGMVGMIPVPVIIMLIIGIALMIVLKYFPFGRYIYALGGNENAARITGVKTDKIKIIVYGLSGLLSAIAGILITCRLGAAQPSVGSGWVMPSVTAAIIGGTSLLGGQGGIGGTIIGSILMGVIANAIVLLSISPYGEKVIVGVVVLVAVAIDRLRTNGNNSN
jgi:Ribose/xylose/arabinose/galactoside ABC-type transport systems, permease components